MPVDDAVTLGEIARRLERLEQKIDRQSSVSPEVFSQQVSFMDKRIGELEDNAKWLIRAIAIAYLGILGTIVGTVVSRGVG